MADERSQILLWSWPAQLRPATCKVLNSTAFRWNTSRVLDPVETLTFAAARAERIAMGTSVLNLPWYNPVSFRHR